MIHAGITSGCANCHESNYVWMSMGQYPITTTAPFKGFQTRPQATSGTFFVADSKHPTTGDCSNCHASFSDFTSPSKPANHIPTATGAVCGSCHTNADFSVMPAIADIHANAPSTTANCVQCHSTTNAGNYAIAAIGFSIVAPPSNHIGMGALSCESCHVGSNSSLTLPVQNTAKFTNSAFSHSGITAGCASCHGATVTASTFAGILPKTIGSLSPAHVPSTLSCESCHINSVPAMLIPLAGASGTMTTFAGAQFSHSGITSGCDTCHGPNITNSSFYGISKIVVMPATSPVGANAHLPSSTKCESCHLGTTPSGLVPGVATKSAPGSGFLTPAPTQSMIHAGITSGCSNCHEKGYLWMSIGQYPITPTTKIAGASYTGFQTRPYATATTYSVADASHPASGDCSLCHGNTTAFTAIDKPANHIPTAASASCTACHTNPDFSVMPTLVNIHANAPTPASNCAQCHSTTNAAAYATTKMSPALVAPPAKHVPFGTTACETCHVGATSSLTLPVQNTAKFTNSAFSHSGITTGCDVCHGAGITGASFTGISSIVVIPSSAAPGTTSHIPTTATCESCHLGSTPSGLIAASATKATGPGTGFKLPAPTGTMIHAGISTGCSACHEKGYLWMSMDPYPINPSSLIAGASYKGFQTRPWATATTYSVANAGHPAADDCSKCHAGTTSFSAAGKPTGHMPTTIATCSTCHVVSGNYSITGLGSNTVLHTGISSGCISCHTAGTGAGPFAGCSTPTNCPIPQPLSYQPKTMPLASATASPTAPSTLTHIPVAGIACEACHSKTNFTVFSGISMGTSAHHTAVSSKTCMSCHEARYTWFGVAMSGKTRPSGHTGTKAAPNDCNGSKCHTYSGGFQALIRPVLRQALVNPGLGQQLPNLQVLQPGRASPGSAFDHTGVYAGQCKTCHDGLRATGMPARHLMVSSSCDSCHRTTTWLPAQFSHSGITPNTCLVCHNGLGASAKPAGHFLTTRSCDSCHKTENWKPVNYSHLSPLYTVVPDKITCVSCHATNGEFIPRQLRSRTPVKPIPVGP